LLIFCILADAQIKDAKSMNVVNFVYSFGVL